MMYLNIILQGQAQGGTGSFMMMMGLMLVVMYFFMIRPQQKKVKAQKKFVDEMKKGDRIITTGGIHGKIISIDDTTVIIENEGNRLKIEKAAISSEMSAPLNKVEEAKVESK